MRLVSVFAALLLGVSSVSAQQERSCFTEFIEKAELSVSKDLSMFKFDIEKRFKNVGFVKLNDLYAQFGSKWSNVIMALTMAQATDKSIGYVLTKYNRSKPTNWETIASELEIKDNSASKEKVEQLISSQIKAWRLEDGFQSK